MMHRHALLHNYPAQQIHSDCAHCACSDEGQALHADVTHVGPLLSQRIHPQ